MRTENLYPEGRDPVIEAIEIARRRWDEIENKTTAHRKITNGVLWALGIGGMGLAGASIGLGINGVYDLVGADAISPLSRVGLSVAGTVIGGGLLIGCLSKIPDSDDREDQSKFQYLEETSEISTKKSLKLIPEQMIDKIRQGLKGGLLPLTIIALGIGSLYFLQQYKQYGVQHEAYPYLALGAVSLGAAVVLGYLPTVKELFKDSPQGVEKFLRNFYKNRSS